MTHAQVLENQVLRLDLALEPALHLQVTDKRTGMVWSCPRPPFVVHCWEAHHYDVHSSVVCRELGWESKLVPEQDSLTLQCTWPRAACGFRAVFHLRDNFLEVKVPARRLVENRAFDMRLMALDVLSEFGAARTGEDGFLLIPRDRGCICRFNKTQPLEAARLVYADGDHVISAPVFGMSRAQGGFLGIIREGEFAAELVASANSGEERNRNSVFPRFKTRLHSGDRLDEDVDFSVIYSFLTQAEADVVGMAKTYRHYLLETMGQPSLKQRCQLRPRLATAIAPTVHVLLAEKRKLTNMSGEGELNVRTHLDEVPKVVKAMKAGGITGGVVLLSGWNCEGRDGLYPTRFPIESAVGGADSMTYAVREIKNCGYVAGAVDNYTDMYRRSPTFNGSYSALQFGGDPWRGGVWAGGQSYIICPAEALHRHVQRDMRRLSDMKLDGLLFLDHCPGPGVLSCYNPDHPLTRVEYAKAIGDLIRSAQSTFGLCRVSGLSVFAALMADSCHLSVHEVPQLDGLTTDWFADEAVPFLPLALHGIVLMTADAQADPLRVIEYGAAPVYPLTAGDATKVIAAMKEMFPRYAAELAPLATEFVEQYETPEPEVIRVGYSNGASVVINRRPDPATVGGVRVRPNDFCVIK